MAFKNYVERDRKSFEMVADVQEFENLQKFQKVLALFKMKIEKLLHKKCSLIIQVIEKRFLAVAQSSESKVFWLKLIGDFYRY